MAGDRDSGLSPFALVADGSLTNIRNIADDATLKLAFVNRGTSATVDGATYVYAKSTSGSGLSDFEVSADGTLTTIQFAVTYSPMTSPIEP